MKKIFLLSALLLVLMSFAFISCNNSQEKRSNYTINASYNAQTKTISADMSVEYYNDSETELSNVMFHLYPRAYREGAKYSPIENSSEQRQAAYPNGIDYGDMSILNVKASGKEQPIVFGGKDEDILIVSANVNPYSVVTIDIVFDVKLANIRHRLGYADDIANLGNWYPIACDFKQGEFEAEPYYSNGDPFNSDFSNYSVKITVPKDYIVASSGKQTITQNGENTVYAAKIQNARDFAAVIGKFNVEKGNANGVDINFYYIFDADPKKSVQTAVDSIKTFSSQFGGYIYDTLSVVKTPFLHGGMEYPSLVYVSDILNDSLQTEVIIHETAHQWWYAAVGSDQINEAWLDEGLTEYSTTLFYEQNPDYGVTLQDRLADALTSYLLYCEKWKDNGKSDTSMNRAVSQYANALEYNMMTYVKGELMLDTLRSSIGKDTFFEGLKKYYQDNKGKTASADSLIGAFESVAKAELKNFFMSWIEGKVKMFAS